VQSGCVGEFGLRPADKRAGGSDLGGFDHG
jgi:hypothetical protein